MRLISLIILLLNLPIAAEKNCLTMDITILADMSASVQGYEHTVADGIKTFIDRFNLSEAGIRIGVITFSGDTDIHLQLAPTSDMTVLNQYVQAINTYNAAGGTALSKTLSKAHNMLVSERFFATKVIIIISDGDINQMIYDKKSSAYISDDRELTTKYANLVKNSNIIISGILINSDWSKTDAAYLRSLTTPGYYLETNYENLVRELEKLSICL